MVENPKDLKGGPIYLLNMCLSGWSICECCVHAYHEKAPWLLGIVKNNIVHWFYNVNHTKEGLWFFVKIVKQSLGSWNMLFSCSYVLLIWGMVSWALVYVIHLGSGIYVTKCKQEFGFLWKSDVVMGSYGLKKLRRRRKASGFKKERSKRFDPLETSSLFLLK